MFNFYNLASGSSGNSSYIETDSAKILLDSGISHKRINDFLKNKNVEFSDIDGILITHEHSDHVSGLKTILNKYDIPIYSNEETIRALEKKYGNFNHKIIENNQKFEIKDLEVKAFSIPHDAVNPVAFNFRNSNKKLSIATDIGHITNNIMLNLEGSDYILIESNYDNGIMKTSSYPYHLKNRIKGPYGHLENMESGEVIALLKNLGTTKFMLGHLSKENNDPQTAYSKIMEVLIKNRVNLDDISIKIAKRDSISDKVDLNGSY